MKIAWSNLSTQSYNRGKMDGCSVPAGIEPEPAEAPSEYFVRLGQAEKATDLGHFFAHAQKICQTEIFFKMIVVDCSIASLNIIQFNRICFPFE